MPDRIARPFPLLLEVEFLDRLSEPVREGRAKSVSGIIRAALEQYDFSNMVVVHSSQLQISVRLSGEIRKNLKKISRSKHTSIGQLVRAAVEAYLPKLEASAPPVKKKTLAAKKRTKPKRKKKTVPKRKREVAAKRK